MTAFSIHSSPDLPREGIWCQLFVLPIGAEKQICFFPKKIIREGLLGSTWFISLFSFGEVLPIWGVLHKRADRWRDFASLLFSFLRKPASETSLDVKLEGLEREGRRTKSERRPECEAPISYWSLLKSFLLSSSLHLRAFRMNLSRKSRPGCRETERQHWQWLMFERFPWFTD